MHLIVNLKNKSCWLFCREVDEETKMEEASQLLIFLVYYGSPFVVDTCT